MNAAARFRKWAGQMAVGSAAALESSFGHP